MNLGGVLPEQVPELASDELVESFNHTETMRKQRKARSIYDCCTWEDKDTDLPQAGCTTCRPIRFDPRCVISSIIKVDVFGCPAALFL